MCFFQQKRQFFLKIGGAVTKNSLIDILRGVGQSQGESYSYANGMANHVLKV
jgi:hypothetical protein